MSFSKNNKDSISYQNYQKQTKINNIITNLSFEECIYQPQKILPILESSLENQKNFILFILNNFNGFPEIKSIKIVKQIFNILPVIIRKLDLPFSLLLLEENDLLQLFIDIYITYNDFSNQIASTFENIYYLFEHIENELITSPLNDWKEILYELEIIKEDVKYNDNDYFSNVEIMFINLNNLYDNWIQFRNMGHNIEEEYLNDLDEILKKNQQELFLLKNDNSISNAIIYFFEEMISKIKKFRSEKFLSTYKYINNELSLEDEMNNDNYQENYNNNYININNGDIINSNIKNDFKSRQQIIQEVLTNLRNIPLNKRTFFYKNEKVIEDESEYIEYKDYYFPFGDKQILELRRQILGFVNSNGGRLYIGITDTKIIKGIVLNNNSLITFQNLIFSCIDNFNPHIADGKIKIYYIPIKNIQNDSYINDLYIIKILIYPGNPTILYSMSFETFIASIRLQGQCANLTAEEIHKEIIERNKNKKLNKIKTYNEEDFNDPEPEIVEQLEKYYEDYEGDYNNRYDYIYENNTINQGHKRGNNNRALRNGRRRKNKHKKKRGNNVTVKVHNIDDKIYVNELKNIFKNCGCISCQFFSKRNGKSRGFGYLQFANDNSANICISRYNNKILGNKMLKLKKENLK